MFYLKDLENFTNFQGNCFDICCDVRMNTEMLVKLHNCNFGSDDTKSVHGMSVFIDQNFVQGKVISKYNKKSPVQLTCQETSQQNCQVTVNRKKFLKESKQQLSVQQKKYCYEKSDTAKQ